MTEAFVYPNQDANNPDEPYEELGDTFSIAQGEPITPNDYQEEGVIGST